MLDLTTLQSLCESYLLELPQAEAGRAMPAGSAISAWIDHTLLKPEATAAQVEKLCQEAVEYHFASVCINPVYVPLASRLLAATDVRVCTVVGFPLGASLSGTKANEAAACLQAGASEVDMVLHVGSLKSETFSHVYEDILGVVESAQKSGAVVKVIIETSALTKKEKIIACLISKAAGADFVKTSTGFGSGGATIEDVDLMFRVSSPQVKVKASGGIRTLKDARAMIVAGASRLGTSSGVNIMKEVEGNPGSAR
jgi:deoxyribose-phosphate aldolase